MRKIREKGDHAVMSFTVGRTRFNLMRDKSPNPKGFFYVVDVWNNGKRTDTLVAYGWKEFKSKITGCYFE